MANSTMVLSDNAVIDRQTLYSQEERDIAISTPQQTTSTSVEGQSGVSCMFRVRKHFQKQGFTKRTIEILMSSWKTGTKKQYSSCIERWIRYCREREVNQFQPDIKSILEYFSYLFDLGLGSSTLNTTRGTFISFWN
jgi:hypothetical protein